MRIRLSIQITDPLLDKSQEIDQIVQEEAEEIKKLFEQATETWNNPPNFTISRRIENGKLVYNVKPTGPNADQFGYVNEGTSIRYAHMTSDFLPKSRPGILGAQAGRGGLAYIDKNSPKPGIVAREFDKAIVERRKDIFTQRIRAALRANNA